MNILIYNYYSIQKKKKNKRILCVVTFSNMLNVKYYF